MIKNRKIILKQLFMLLTIFFLFVVTAFFRKKFYMRVISFTIGLSLFVMVLFEGIRQIKVNKNIKRGFMMISISLILIIIDIYILL